jgi:hypothetical protein
MPPLAEMVLLACWRSSGHVVGAAGGTIRSLAQAVDADNAATGEAVQALQEAGFVAIDRFGIVTITPEGDTEARSRQPYAPHPS